jgi:hypothetical protein
LSIDGRFIENLATEINNFTENTRINKIQQLSKTDFLLSLSTSENLVISLSTALARIHLTKERYKDFLNPGGFCMFLRKYIEKGIIKKVQSLNGDRIVEITVNNRNVFTTPFSKSLAGRQQSVSLSAGRQSISVSILARSPGFGPSPVKTRVYIGLQAEGEITSYPISRYLQPGR